MQFIVWIVSTYLFSYFIKWIRLFVVIHHCDTNIQSPRSSCTYLWICELGHIEMLVPGYIFVNPFILLIMWNPIFIWTSYVNCSFVKNSLEYLSLICMCWCGYSGPLSLCNYSVCTLCLLIICPTLILVILCTLCSYRSNRTSLFDGIEEGGIRATSYSSHEIDEQENDRAIDGLQDRVSILKRVLCHLNFLMF